MIVQVEIKAPKGRDPRKSDVQKNIDAIERAKERASCGDSILLYDTLTVLKALQQKLPD